MSSVRGQGINVEKDVIDYTAVTEYPSKEELENRVKTSAAKLLDWME
jgi:hypothetical protein